MRNQEFAIYCLMSILTFTSWTMSQTPPPREHFQNSEVIYGWAQDSAGHRLRTSPLNYLAINHIVGKCSSMTLSIRGEYLSLDSATVASLPH